MRSSQSKAARVAPRAFTLVLALATSGGALFASGCGGSIDIAMTPLAGVIGGAPWALASAESSAFLSDGSPTFFVTAYAESVTPCTGAGGSVTSNELILNIPKTAGDYRLSLGLSQTFYVRSTGNNLVATSGGLRVDQVTATTVSGGAHFSFDGNNQVNGLFTVPLCAQ